MKTNAKLTTKSPQRGSSTTLRPASKSKPAPQLKTAAQLKQHGQKQSKQNRVFSMLRQKQGTTITAVMKETGWQKHSVRGFFAGIVRKKLGLTLVSGVVNGERVYRITDRKPVKADPQKGKRAA